MYRHLGRLTATQTDLEIPVRREDTIQPFDAPGAMAGEDTCLLGQGVVDADADGRFARDSRCDGRARIVGCKYRLRALAGDSAAPGAPLTQADAVPEPRGRRTRDCGFGR